MLGNAFDHAVNTCGIPGDRFVKLFISSTVSRQIENGEPKYLTGKSGAEVVQDILAETAGMQSFAEPLEYYARSPEYWVGWAAAYYQWYSGRRFGEIFRAVSFDEMREIYYPLHEADISKFTEIMDARFGEAFPETGLKRIRTLYGCSQAQLARLSGVSLRSIQMYEQRNKDINRASAETVRALARTLGCTMEDLME